MNTNQMRKAKAVKSLLRHRSRPPSLAFGRDSRAGRGAGRFQVCPGGGRGSEEVVAG